ncbi:alpha-hydroxy acid oxidase [Leadbettera azotonutricia]|uniref:(S)-2-hydroxy-acid oxidase n=1 Tax=Leadbettera azotonutricia (strain ATCC BAA-888 / DSM 13862 / ZAS-9) TaxID=545695 RepID=F5YAI7_LEAAZ|nr:alpha-hydroxy acid oxidase [Leadbettera azotonutricia]AEF80577.1 (S)-2-hydroxy-acid oxidase [Leadbettera azotonutricia ZAS-9]
MGDVFNAGDSAKITRDYLDSILVEMRHIDGVLPSTKLELYGETFSTPVMFAALSHLDSTRPNGMVESAKGIKAAGAVMWAGMGSEAELEAITATGARTIKIIKPYADNKDIFKKIEQAEKCGCLAVGIDTDHAFDKKGRYDVVHDLPMRPKSLEEIREFVKATKLPFIIKGVLSEQDAYKCLNAGVRGIVVSHHHGHIDYSLPPLRILPRIAKIVNKQIPIFVDCSIDRGMDVFKALALGATAASVGRAIMPALKDEGAAGVQKKIEEMTAELAGAMAATCSADISHIDSSVLWGK